MALLNNLLGPRSKYDKTLPYTYEARIRIFEDSDDHKSYFSDTVCGLIEYLHENNIAPNAVSIFEIYREHEVPIEARFFATPDGAWLFKPDICRAFEQHYKGHIHEKTCSFKDRARGGVGP